MATIIIIISIFFPSYAQNVVFVGREKKDQGARIGGWGGWGGGGLPNSGNAQINTFIFA